MTEMIEVSYEEVKRQTGTVEQAQKAAAEVIGKGLKEAKDLLSSNKIPFVILPGKKEQSKGKTAHTMDVVSNRVRLTLNNSVVERAELG